MKQQTQTQDFELYELPERIGFKFVYAQAVNPDYAQSIIDDLEETK